MEMDPVNLTRAELEAAEAEAEARHQQRTRDLRERGWGRPIPYSRHDLYNFAIDRWHMQQGIEPEEQK